MLAAAGYEVEEAVPPELARVNEIWADVLNADLQQALPLLTPVMSESALELLRLLLRRFDPASKTITEITRSGTGSRSRGPRSSRLPGRHRATWADLPFLHDADLDPDTGIDTTLNRLQFITPGNLLGYRRLRCRRASRTDCRRACRFTPSAGARTCASTSPA